MLCYSDAEDIGVHTEIIEPHLTTDDNVVVPHESPNPNSKHRRNSTVNGFLSIDQVLEEMKSAPVHEHVPLGVKENMYFNVCNKENKARARSGKLQQWWDDCGAYDNTMGSKSHYLVNDRNALTAVKIANGKYVKRSQEKRH